MATLTLTLKKEWFDLISSGEKKEEYREIKQYWSKRFDGRHYDTVLFRNGYHSDSPTVQVELKGITVGVGNQLWGAPEEEVYILHLGDILDGHY